MSRLSDRVRGIVSPAGSAAIQETAGAGGVGGGLQELGGTWLTGTRSRVFLVEQCWSYDARYGSVRVGDVAERIERACEHATLIAAGPPVRPPFVFFDLETTGLSGGAGTYAFLVGCGSFEANGSFVTRQFLLPGFGDERPMLEVVAAELASAGALVSFNGKSFDAPVLETRYLFHRLEWAAKCLPHLDVLHSARRFWGARQDTSSCTLVDLEHDILGAVREGDVPGFEIPGRYFSFVRSGDARPLAAVLDHNRRDLLSLAGLTARLLQLVADGAAEARDPGEALALGRVYAAAGRDRHAREALMKAVVMADAGHGQLKVAALRSLARLDRRGGRHTAAAAWWTELLDVPECPEHVAREAVEALAVYHEHRARDLEMAKTFALRNLATGTRASWKEAARHRLARIEGKLSKGTSESLPFSSAWPLSQPPSAGRTSGRRTSS